MKSSNTSNLEQAQAWYKGKTGFIVFALLALLIVSVLVDISLYQQKPPTNNPANLVSFTCRSFSNNQTFTITVDINTKDGMDKDEAIRVAAEVYEKNINTPVRPPVSSSLTVYMREDGCWMVEFDTVYASTAYCTAYCARRHLGTRFFHEYFEAVINPFFHTIEYARA